nr:MAG: ORF1 [TTV-like mini virus]
MPYYQRKRWWRPYTTRRRKRYRRRWRFPLRRRRPTTTFRRRNYFRVRKFKFKKKRKLKTLSLRQWQPQLIRRSKIIGYFTMFYSQNGRLGNNYVQYKDSVNPPNVPGGGGWSIFVFNLGCLFDEFNRVRNWWTTSNVDLPLCRYMGTKLTLYRSEDTDYIFYYSTNYPMTDTAQRHADAQPSRLMLKKHKVIVESRKHNKKKPYKKIFIKPPRQLVNKWFFQRQFVNTNLFLATCTACSLSKFTLNPKQNSTTITFLSLNYNIFKSVNYQMQHTTTYYAPKPNFNLYATDANVDITKPLETQLKYNQLIYLGQATRMIEGKKIGYNSTDVKTYFDHPEYFGNIFHTNYLLHHYTILVCNVQYTAFQGENINAQIKANVFTVLSEPLYETIQYNPDIDTGKDTICYFVPNFQNYTDWKRPDNEQLYFHGYPLWMLFWGWPDWQKKLGLINQIDQHYQLVFENPYCIPKKSKYMPIDQSFLDNTIPYPYKDETSEEINKPSIHDQQNWYPKFAYQQETIDLICQSGPGTYKFESNKCIQAHLKYSVRFKWGGSPMPTETIADPTKQPQYPVPDQVTSTLQIEDPTRDPQTLLYSWDFRRHMLTQKATERLTKNSDFDKPFPISTDSWINPAPPQTEKDILETLLKTQTKEKEKENQVQLLKQLRDHQHRLNEQLKHLMFQSLKL